MNPQAEAEHERRNERQQMKVQVQRLRMEADRRRRAQLGARAVIEHDELAAGRGGLVVENAQLEGEHAQLVHEYGELAAVDVHLVDAHNQQQGRPRFWRRCVTTASPTSEWSRRGSLC